MFDCYLAEEIFTASNLSFLWLILVLNGISKSDSEVWRAFDYWNFGSLFEKLGKPSVAMESIFVSC